MRHRTVVILLVATVALAGCTAGYGGDTSAPADTGGDTGPSGDSGGESGGGAVEVVSGASADTVIETSGTDFVEASAQVSAGDVVEFKNGDNWGHTVTISAEGVNEQLAAGDSVTLKFNEGGSYTVVCTIHGGMETEIGVGQSPATGSSDGSGGSGGGGGDGYY